MSTAIEEPKQKTGTQLDQLEQLKRFTKVVANTAGLLAFPRSLV